MTVGRCGALMTGLLSLVGRYASELMVAFAILGFLFPNLGAYLLPALPQILFFLMFITLMGLNHRQLLRRLFCWDIWRFALLQTLGMTIMFSVIAYIFGARTDLLLAIAAVTATAPLFASGAMVKAIGYDALETMAKTIAATLIMPAVLLLVLWTLYGREAQLQLDTYAWRLLIYIISPLVLAALVKKILADKLLLSLYPPIAQINVFLVISFPFALSGAFRLLVNQQPFYGIKLFVLGVSMSFALALIAYHLYKQQGKDIAIPAAITSGGRNVLLTYTIAAPFLGDTFLPLIGAMQLPMYLQLWIARKIEPSGNKR